MPVDLWIFRLDDLDAYFRRVAGVTSTAERARATTFATDRLRLHYLITKGLTRATLATYLGVSPSTIQYAYTAQGKPAVVGEWSVSFSTADCDRMFAISVTLDVVPLGLDIEPLRPFSDAVAIAERYFCPGEADAVKRKDDPERSEMFLRLWTCKESVVKATGEGLYRDLRSFELRAIGTSRPQLSWRPDSTERTDRWRHLPWYVTSFVVDCDHVGALAMAGQEPIIRRLPVLCASSLEQSSALDAVLHVC